MSEHKGAITLILVVLVFFAIFITFGTIVFEPMMDKIGNGFSKMVDNVFDRIN